MSRLPTRSFTFLGARSSNARRGLSLVSVDASGEALTASETEGFISTHFNAELQAVDPTKSLTPVISPLYEEDEWSYNGLEVVGGTNNACEHAASELLYAMGFRFFSPNPVFFIRPSSIPTNLTRAKTRYWMPFNRFLLVYGHSWTDSTRAYLLGTQDKWSILNNWKTDVWPAGHRWAAIHNANAQFFLDNPQLLYATTPQGRFKVDVTGQNYANLVMICAAQLLKDGLNPWGRTHFDAADGDTQASDLVFPFTKDVVDQMRAGTTPIGTHPAYPGIPDAQIGTYAYAGHRRPPTESVRPGVYTQVALGFNRTEFTYPELVDLHAAKADIIMLREYLDTQLWTMGIPMNNGRAKEGYMDRYDGFHASGAIGANSECTAHWLVNMVMMHYAVRKLKTGTFTWDDALDDIMPLFNNDPAVRELHEKWGKPAQGYSKYDLRVSMQIVDSMADAWYKIHFQRLLTIYWARDTLPPKLTLAEQEEVEEDPFPDAFQKYMGWVHAVRTDEIMHSYAMARDDAGAGNLRGYYPQFMFNVRPPTGWLVSEVKPTEADFDAALAEAIIETARDEDLDSEDLVLVKTIVPRITATTPADKFVTQGPARYIFVVEEGEEGTFTFTEATTGSVPKEDGVVETETFGPGIHRLAIGGPRVIATWENGYPFLDTFPRVEKRPDHSGLNHWLYLPERYEDEVDLRIIGGSRWTFFDQNGRFDLEEEHLSINIATAGTAANMTLTNVTVMTAQPDPAGGTTAVLITCDSDGAGTTAAIQANTALLINGVNFIRFKAKKGAWASAQAWLRFQLLLTTALPEISLNLNTGATGGNVGFTNVAVEDLGDGWWGFTATLDLTSADGTDVTGNARIAMGDAVSDNTITAAADHAFYLNDFQGGYSDPKNLGPGQIAVHNGNTTGSMENQNGNRWLSAYPTVALLPRVIAEEENLI